MINYHNIANALQFYQSKGFQPIEVPWAVSEEAVTLTAPPNATKYPLHKEGYLVASGEQGFIDLMIGGRLAPGAYSCTTPCFRDDKLDELHQRYFLKVELIDTLSVDETRLEQLVSYCSEFFSSVVGKNLKVVETSPEDPLQVGQAYDITHKGIELGSYGIRQHHKVGRWIYATGCAEPRLSLAKNLATGVDRNLGEC